MVFEHLVFDLNEYDEYSRDGESSQIYIFLDDNVDDDNGKIVAQAISLDIRGDFGFFLNKLKSNNESAYEWTGDLFKINVIPYEGKVRIVDITDEVENVYIVTLNDWIEALLDWKKFYLKTLGFLEFNSVSLSHMFGVLILAYDQMYNEDCSYEMLIEAIKKCSKRYGVNKSVIYRDCKKVSGVKNIKDFYNWAIDLFRYRDRDINLHEHVLKNLDIFSGDIRPKLIKHFGIIL